MSNLNENQFSNHLAAHGISKVSQKAMTMRAAAGDPMDFVGEYRGPGTYNLVNPEFKAMGEERMRELKVKKAYNK